MDLYREVVRSVKEHEDRDHFKTDTLPRLHTLHNLKEVLSTCPPDVGHTLYDDTLSQQVRFSVDIKGIAPVVMIMSLFVLHLFVENYLVSLSKYRCKCTKHALRIQS